MRTLCVVVPACFAVACDGLRSKNVVIGLIPHGVVGVATTWLPFFFNVLLALLALTACNVDVAADVDDVVVVVRVSINVASSPLRSDL